MAGSPLAGDHSSSAVPVARKRASYPETAAGGIRGQAFARNPTCSDRSQGLAAFLGRTPIAPFAVPRPMPYTCSLLPFDLGGFFSAGPPALGGVFTSMGGTPAVNAGIVMPGAAFSVTFPTATPPPPGAATVRVTDAISPVGDLFRSGPLTALPPSPGTITMVTIPTTVTMVPAATVATMTAGLTPIILTPPGWLVAVVTAASGGSFMPITGLITSVTPTLGTPSGTLTLTITGFFTGRTWFVAMTTFTFTGTVTLTPRPSGDAMNPGRILSVTSTAASLTSPGGFGVFLSLFAPILGGMVASMMESRVNSAIDSLTTSGLNGLGIGRSPTSVVSARKITITPSGLSLQMVLADLLGPAITLPSTLANFHIAIAPTPQAGQPQTYTVTITDAATATAVPGATVALNNFDANGLAVHQTKTTDALGRVTFAVTLQKRFLEAEVHGRDVIKSLSPTLRVSKSGFATLTRKLL
jgi:hypothetical protein